MYKIFRINFDCRLLQVSEQAAGGNVTRSGTISSSTLCITKPSAQPSKVWKNATNTAKLENDRSNYCGTDFL